MTHSFGASVPLRVPTFKIGVIEGRAPEAAGGPGARSDWAGRALSARGPRPRVGDVRYSLLCVHWAQCKGVRSRAGNARRPSPVAPTWTFTCARTQASGRISATRVSSASRRSPASIFIRGRTQVGDSRGPERPPCPAAGLRGEAAAGPRRLVLRGRLASRVARRRYNVSVLGTSPGQTVPVPVVPRRLHLQAIPGDSHAHPHRRATVSMRHLPEALHAEIQSQHSQADALRYVCRRDAARATRPIATPGGRRARKGGAARPH